MRQRGSIEEKGPDKYQVRYFVGRTPEGKRVYKSATIHGKLKEAQAYLTAKQRELDLGTVVGDSRTTVGEFLGLWLEEKVRGRVRPSTLTSYRNLIRKHTRSIAPLKIAGLQPFAIQKLINGLSDSGLSPRSVRYVYTLVSSAFRQAVEWGQIPVSPCRGISLPKRSKREMKFLSPEKVKSFLDAARETRHFALFLVAIETGLRPSEYLGLQWKDIDFRGERLTVNRSVKFEKGGYRFEEPKTGKRRSVPISEGLAAELKAHRRAQVEHMMRNRAEYQNNDLVFATETGGPLRYENLRKRNFYPLLEQAGLERVRLYDLRHTTATLLMFAGQHPKVVQERLGHASISITLDTYTHLLPQMQKEATEKMSEILFGT